MSRLTVLVDVYFTSNFFLLLYLAVPKSIVKQESKSFYHKEYLFFINRFYIIRGVKV